MWCNYVTYTSCAEFYYKTSSYNASRQISKKTKSKVSIISSSTITEIYSNQYLSLIKIYGDIILFIHEFKF